MNFQTKDNRLKLQNSFDISGTTTSSKIFIGADVSTSPFILDCSGQAYIRTPLVKIGVEAGLSGQNNDTIAIGFRAGYCNQGTQSIAIGTNTGFSGQDVSAVTIGRFAGYSIQRSEAISIGSYAGFISQSCNAIAIGTFAGYTNQQSTSIAIGSNAGAISQGTNQGGAIAIGVGAGYYNQISASIAIGSNAGYSGQNIAAVAIGSNAGGTNQGQSSIAIGCNAGSISQGDSSIAIGNQAGLSGQDTCNVSIGLNAGYSNQCNNSIALGTKAGYFNQGVGGGYSIAIGNSAGYTAQGSGAIAIGYKAGTTNQHANSIILNASSLDVSSTISNSFYVSPIRNVANNQALYYNTVTKEVTYADVSTGSSLPPGTVSGQYLLYNGSTWTVRGSSNVALGLNSGSVNQNTSSVAIGINAGVSNQSSNTVAIGSNAGFASQGSYAIAIGAQAGQTRQGGYSVAIGYQAGISNLPASTIQINASSNSIPVPTQANALYISPVRSTSNLPSSFPIYYDAVTSEINMNPAASLSGINTGDNIEGMYGDGSDANITLNGGYNSESLFSTYNQSLFRYTLTRDIYPASLTLAGGYTLITAGYRIFCKGTITNNGLIHNNGGDASGTTAGIGGLSGFFRAGGAGAAGLITTDVGLGNVAPIPVVANTFVGNYGGRGACGRLTNVSYVGVANATANMTVPPASSGGRKITSSTSAWICPSILVSGIFQQMQASIGGCSGSKSVTGTNATSGGGGGGGGFMYIAAYNMTGSGLYQCLGGKGGNAAGTGGNFGGGGGGAGGIIIVYTRPLVWTSIASNFSVAGGNGGTSLPIFLATGTNYPVGIAGGSTNTGLLISNNFVVPFSTPRTANYKTLYLLSIFTSAPSIPGVRPLVSSVKGYIGIGTGGLWNRISIVDFDSGSTVYRLELWYGYSDTTVTNVDIMNDTNIRVTFNVQPTTYRLMLDDFCNTAIVDGAAPTGQSTFNSIASGTTISTSLGSAPTTGNIVYTVVARSTGTAPTAGTGNTLLNNQTTAPLIVSEVSNNQQTNTLSWTTAAAAGAISVEINQASIGEPGAKGWEGRIIQLGG